MTTAAGLLVLRAMLAFVLVSHGGHVLFGLAAGGGLGPGGLDQAAARFSAAGLEPGFLVAVIVGVVQFAGGLLIAAGFMVRWATVATMALISILLWKLEAQWGFYINWLGDPTRGHGTEFSLLMIGALACLLLTGPGDWSLDGRRATYAASRAAGRARLRHRA
jgi:putative oxidoreductase